MRRRIKVRLAYSIVFFIIGLVVGNLLSFYYAPLTGRAVKAEATKEVIKIGAILPLTGDAAKDGESARKGIEVAVKEINDKKLLRNKLEVIFEDGKCESREAVTTMQKLVNIDKVKIVIGEMCSSATLAIAPIAEENKIVLISPASTSPEITKAGDFIFRTVPSDALQGLEGAKLVDSLNYKRLAIININDDYGIGFKNVLKKSFIELGNEVVAEETFERNSKDMRTQLTRIKDKNPDSIYVISNALTPAGIILRQIQELGLPVQVFGSEGLRDQAVLDNSLGAAEGLILTSLEQEIDENWQRFEKLHKDMFKADPGIFSAESYDATRVIAEAIKNSDGTSIGIKNALYTLTYNGASGLIDFDENGDAIKGYNALIVRNGKFVDLDSIR